MIHLGAGALQNPLIMISHF